MAYRENIEKITLKNTLYRKILYTDDNQQLTIMSIPPFETIPLEKHKNSSQFIRIEKGSGILRLYDDDNKIVIKRILDDGVCVIIPKDTYHIVENTANKPLKLYSVYSPPVHDV